MKKLIIIALILAAGLTAYPQSSRSSQAAKSSKGSSSQVASRSSSKSSSNQVKKSNNNQSNSKATASRTASSSRSAVKSSSGSNRSTAPKATQSRSSSTNNRSSAVKSNNKQIIQSGNARQAVPSKINNSERGRSQSSTVKTHDDNGNNQGRRDDNSSYNRSDRQGNKTYVRNDGREFRHQNDEVFTRNRYRTDYRDEASLRRSNEFLRVHNDYYNWYSRRHVRNVVVYNHFYRPLSIEIRRVRYPYRVPVHLDLCWTPYLHNSFMYYYPLHDNWNTNFGDYIETASSYEAMNYVGSVKRVYGKVEEVFYSPEDQTYTLYFGAPYPYHDFSVVVPRGVAKSFSWSPSWYFEDEHVWVVGLIEVWEGKPEIVLHDEQQIRRY